jgi:hypothetical protein
LEKKKTFLTQNTAIYLEEIIFNNVSQENRHFAENWLNSHFYRKLEKIAIFTGNW